MMLQHTFGLFTLVTMLMNVKVIQSDFPPGFRPANAIPDEFFTCVQRAPGPYADDKRSCALYWQCSPNGTLEHIPCPSSAPVFDDRVGDCVKAAPAKCPVDYGFFQSASSFCRGRPYPVSGSIGNESERRVIIQAYYANRLNNCDSFFLCFIANGESHGLELKCPVGKKFDNENSGCVEEHLVTCPVSHGADLG